MAISKKALKKKVGTALKTNKAAKHAVFFAKSIKNKKRLTRLAMTKIKEAKIPGMTKERAREMVHDYLKEYRKHGYKISEYLGFKLYEKDEAQRREYIPDWERFGYTDAFNDPKNARLFDDKWLTYQRFGKYYGREVISCRKPEDKESFYDFIGRHMPVAIKPTDASFGVGFQILREADENTFDKLLADYKTGFMVEELIQMDPRIAKFHPSSVNTCRLITIRFDDETIIIHPRFKMGRHGSEMDNASSGGIFCNLDPETGEVLYAADFKGVTWDVHPDTGEQLLGFVVPEWDAAKAFVRELAEVVPENRYTGWDIVLTPKGWIMIEGNRRGQFGWQYSDAGGARPEIEGYLNRLGRKY